MFATIRDAACHTKKGRGSIQASVAATIQVADNFVFVDRHFPNFPNGHDFNAETVEAPPRDVSEPVYLDVRSVKNPATKGRNVRYRVACAPGWSTSFTIMWDKTVVSVNEMRSVLNDAGALTGIQAMHDMLKNNPEEPDHNNPPSFWWLDCGNVNNFGRVLLGSAHSPEHMQAAFPAPGRCISLPSPAIQYPDLLKPKPEETELSAGMSCAERAAANLQSLNINAAVIVQAADMLTRLLVTRDLKRFACENNLSSGVVKSSYVIPEDVACASRKPVSYLMGADTLNRDAGASSHGRG